MSDKKIIAVVGATGAQGGGLVRAILNDKNSEFSVRALTRKPDSEKAKELEQLGAEIVYADLDKHESLNEAFRGAYGVFCVTNFWEHYSPEKEKAQALSMALAANEEKVQHAIWSMLEDTRKFIPLSDNRMPTLMERYKVPHFDAKGESLYYFKESNVPTTYLLTSFYWDNMIYFGMGPKRGTNGTYDITLPMGDKKLPGIAAEDIGKCAYGIFKAGNKYIGKTVGIAGEHISGEGMANVLSNVMSKDIRYNNVSPEVYRGFGFPGAEDLGNMFQFKRDFEDYYCGARSIEVTRELNPELQSFEKWAEKNKERIPLE